ncbi:U4 protein [Pea necrotic yellow dwarf virus]|uniref:U4 protein n=1 Tax=Pea necrotic yellow dwarf virus TaxID=753670 RepID=I6QCK7_9VIRU|nr:U4 protein [Pea necrotic yellow dwarf virus]AFK65517.1 U4 protein [Pea necrotic yellow dwarf virus]
MERRFIFFFLLVLTVLNSSFVMNLILGYVLGVLLVKNIPGLRAMLVGERDVEIKSEDDTFVEGVAEDVRDHLKTLGLDVKVEGEDLEYLQSLWKELRNHAVNM